jgi:hypothetical protein
MDAPEELTDEQVCHQIDTTFRLDPTGPVVLIQAFYETAAVAQSGRPTIKCGACVMYDLHLIR